MDYEVDFHPVGDGERSKDAIYLRLGNINADRAPRRKLIASE